MNQQEAKQFLPFVQALAEGKVIQIWDNAMQQWVDIPEPAFQAILKDYRIKPSPKLRPWKPEEVPVGCCFRYKTYYPNVRCMILSVNDDGICYVDCGCDTIKVWFKELAELCEHSLDYGVTWLPCGVMEK